MSHFAKVEGGIVTQVIVADQDVIDSGMFADGWVQTSYSTRGGVHCGPDGKPDGGVPLRGNYAGVGFIYDKANDAFYPPQPYPSWSLDKTWAWQPPKPYPADGKDYAWDEPTKSWVAG